MSSGTFSAFGRSFKSVPTRGRRVELAAGQARRADQFVFIHLNMFQLAGRGVDAERGGRDGPFQNGRRQQADVVVSLGGLRQRPLEDVARRRETLSERASSAPALSFATCTATSPVDGREARVREPHPDLDRLIALIALAVGLDLRLSLADELRAGEEANRLNPEAAEVPVADAEPPAPGVIDGVEHRLPRADELVDEDRQLAVGAGLGRMLGQHERGGLLARGFEIPNNSGSDCQIWVLDASSSPNRKIGLVRPSAVNSGRNALKSRCRRRWGCGRLGQFDGQKHFQGRAAIRQRVEPLAGDE